MSKTLTIALTTYNRPNFLKESIKSILNQTFNDFDLVILDNGSTNETSSVVQSFNDNRISYVRNQINDLEFVNNAFSYTKNYFLMIFHDDDIMEPTMLEEMIKIIKSDKEINTISCSINLINSNSKNLNKSIMCISKSKVYHIGSGSKLSSNDKIYLNHRNSLFTLIKNVDKKKLPIVLLVRSFFEFTTFFFYLFKGKLSKSLMIIKAFFMFILMFTKFYSKREKNFSIKYYRRVSIIIDLYLFGKNKFSDF